MSAMAAFFKSGFLCVLFILAFQSESFNCESFQENVLNFHNLLRSSVYPTASHMRKLVWNANLAETALSWAQSCRFRHSGSDAENVHFGEGNATVAIMMWFLERENYDLTSESCGLQHGVSQRYYQLETCSHYTQIVSADLLSVGCGYANCKKGNFLVCQYDAKSSSPPYTSGTSCSTCPEDSPWCENGLCISEKTNSSHCGLKCKNCQTLVSTATECRCNCDDDYSGVLCEKSSNRNENDGHRHSSRPPKCDVCSAAGTPCIHNGIPASENTCRCICPYGYEGDHCEINSDQLRHSATLHFAKGNRSESPFPVLLSSWPRMWSSFSQILTNRINQYCRDPVNFTFCCMDYFSYNQSVPLQISNIVNTSNVAVANHTPYIDKHGYLVSMVYAVIDPQFCAQGELRDLRMRRSAPTMGNIQYLPGSTMQIVVDLISKNISAATIACCGSGLPGSISSVFVPFGKSTVVYELPEWAIALIVILLMVLLVIVLFIINGLCCERGHCLYKGGSKEKSVTDSIGSMKERSENGEEDCVSPTIIVVEDYDKESEKSEVSGVEEEKLGGRQTEKRLSVSFMEPETEDDVFADDEAEGEERETQEEKIEEPPEPEEAVTLFPPFPPEEKSSKKKKKSKSDQKIHPVDFLPDLYTDGATTDLS